MTGCHLAAAAAASVRGDVHCLTGLLCRGQGTVIYSSAWSYHRYLLCLSRVHRAAIRTS